MRFVDADISLSHSFATLTVNANVNGAGADPLGVSKLAGAGFGPAGGRVVRIPNPCGAGWCGYSVRAGAARRLFCHSLQFGPNHLNGSIHLF